MDCQPGITLLDPGELPIVARSEKEVVLEIAHALVLAVRHIVTELGGSVEGEAVSWGNPRAFPTCCDRVEVGIRTPGVLSNQDGHGYRPHECRWELLISQSRPLVTKNGPPLDGFRDAEPHRDTVTGHALRMYRINEAIQRQALAITRLHLPADCAACNQLKITSIDTERETCDQIRFTIEAITQ